MSQIQWIPKEYTNITRHINKHFFDDFKDSDGVLDKIALQETWEDIFPGILDKIDKYNSLGEESKDLSELYRDFKNESFRNINNATYHWFYKGYDMHGNRIVNITFYNEINRLITGVDLCNDNDLMNVRTFYKKDYDLDASDFVLLSNSGIRDLGFNTNEYWKKTTALFKDLGLEFDNFTRAKFDKIMKNYWSFSKFGFENFAFYYLSSFSNEDSFCIKPVLNLLSAKLGKNERFGCSNFVISDCNNLLKKARSLLCEDMCLRDVNDVLFYIMELKCLIKDKYECIHNEDYNTEINDLIENLKKSNELFVPFVEEYVAFINSLMK